MNESLALNAAILVGGLGTRLRPVVADRPKVLAEVAGRPFLAHLLDQVCDAGVTRIVLCTGYMAHLVRDNFGETYRGATLHYSVEEQPLGTGGALRQAASLFRTDDLLVANGDSYCAADLGELVRTHQQRCALATVLLTRVDDASRYGRVHLDANDAITQFSEKDNDPRPGLINAGIYVVRSTELKALSGQGTLSLEREVFPTWIDRGFYGHATTGRFIDIGTPESFELAQSFFNRGAV